MGQFPTQVINHKAAMQAPQATTPDASAAMPGDQPVVCPSCGAEFVPNQDTIAPAAMAGAGMPSEDSWN